MLALTQRAIYVSCLDLPCNSVVTKEYETSRRGEAEPEQPTGQRACSCGVSRVAFLASAARRRIRGSPLVLPWDTSMSRTRVLSHPLARTASSAIRVKQISQRPLTLITDPRLTRTDVK